MEIVIAILLALILVALVSSNKDAASSVSKAIRIGLFLFLIGLTWLILIGYSLFYFYSYTDMGWYSMLGLVVPVVIPPLLAWFAKEDIKRLFKEDNKTIFKTLAYILLGVIAWVTVSILFQEQKKVDPNFGWVLLIATFVISGIVIFSRCMEKGWKHALTFKPSPWDQVNLDYDKLQDEENARWQAFAETYTGNKDGFEYEQLMDEHFARYDAIDKERYEQLEKVRGVKKKEDWWLFAFYCSLVFICFGLLGYVYDYAFDYVMTLKFVKGREWVANATLIGAIVLSISGIYGMVDEAYRNKQQKKKHLT